MTQPNGGGTASNTYLMRVSRMTVNNLGVKLYDKASAVVAELVANAHDADAELVTVKLPINSLLARRTDEGIEGYGYIVEVIDDGHGMTPEEAQEHFLQVGRDRRRHPSQGACSRHKNRPVMGRKGIGKLAPFGICRRIEVISAGGEKTEEGFTVSHFIMDYDRILDDTDRPVPLETGDLDRTFAPNTGTTIRLLEFLPKRVPDQETFHRQLARRFGLRLPDFRILVEDTRDPDGNPPFEVGEFRIPLMDNTRVDVSTRPVELDGHQLPVSGWMGLSQTAYKNEEMAGVRIYARGKIVATTRDFEQPAGYTNEFTMRSYLVGEVTAEWLDEDEGEDLIRTDRQDIIWDSEYGKALRDWGAGWIREIGVRSRKPRRTKVTRLFLDRAKVEQKARLRFKDEAVVQTALDLASKIGGFAAEDELDDPEYVEDLTDVILSVAPHKALMEAFAEFNQTVFGDEGKLERILDLFEKGRVAELASYSQIAAERVRAIRKLEDVIDAKAEEDELQKILAGAPWLVEPTWTPVTANQGLKLFVRRFEAFYKDKYGEEIALSIAYERKRPDFTLVSVGRMLHIVEIKSITHIFDDTDFERLTNYLEAFEEFFEVHGEVARAFPQGWRIDLVAAGVGLSDPKNKRLYEYWSGKHRIQEYTWVDFLQRAVQANEEFLEVEDKVRQVRTELAADGG